MASRMLEVPGVSTRYVIPDGGGSADTTDALLGDIRIRVDLTALAQLLGPKAIKSRSKRVELYNGAITIDAFNVRKAES